MCKYKTIFFISMLLLISVFTNIVLFVNLSANKQRQVTDDTDKTVSNIGCSDKFNHDDIIRNFFTSFFEYNNSTYEQRYEEIKLYVSENVYQSLTAGERPKAPKVSVVNRLLELQIFEGEKEDFIVIVKTKSIIENTESKDVSQIFKVHLQGNGIIDRLEGLGNIEM